jgi:hypothetical protein
VIEMYGYWSISLANAPAAAAAASSFQYDTSAQHQHQKANLTSQPAATNNDMQPVPIAMIKHCQAASAR